jgi:hypothetical protein
MKLADIKKFSKKRKNNNPKPATTKVPVYGGIGGFYDFNHSSSSDSGTGGGGGDGGGGGE